MKCRVPTLLTTLAATTIVLSTIGARPETHYVWNASESVPIAHYTFAATVAA